MPSFSYRFICSYIAFGCLSAAGTTPTVAAIRDAWASYSMREMHVKGSMTCTHVSTSRIRLDTVVDLELHPDCGAITEFNRLTGSRTAFIANSRYFAKVSASSHGWKLEELSMRSEATTQGLLSTFNDYRAAINIGTQFRWGVASLTDLLNEPNFHITQIASTDSNVVVYFTYHHTSRVKGGGYIPHQQGQMRLSRCYPYLLVSLEADVAYNDDSGTVLEKISYGDNDLPRFTERIQKLRSKGNSVYRIEFDLLPCAHSIDESRFTLSAFGLEEPHGVTWPKPTPYWLYGTLGSIAVIVLGILLMRWSQRRSARAVG